MNILNKISIKNLKLNKKRTISTIIGIILSCALICAVASMATSFQETLVENSINETGYYHLKISNVTDENIKTLKNNRDIKDIYTVHEIGYGKLENGQNEDKPYLKLYSMDNIVFKELKFDLIEGKFPTGENEVVISKHIIHNGKVNYKIGDKIRINIGTRKSLDNYDLDYSNPYNEEDEQSKCFEKIKDLSEALGYAREVKEYKLNPDKYKGHVGDVSMVIRISLTTKSMTPNLYDIMRLLGKKRILNRIKELEKNI